MLRHVAGSERPLHIELRGDDLSAMVWGDSADATVPWRGATSLQSVVLLSATKLTLSLHALRELPLLTHRHLPAYFGDYKQSDDSLQYIARHLGDRLTFLRLTMEQSQSQPSWPSNSYPPPQSPLSSSFAAQCTALQSLHIVIDAKSVNLQPDHLPPQLSELTLTIFNRSNSIDRQAPIVLAPLPATLTYLEVHCCSVLLVLQMATGDNHHSELHTALPQSLLCLSLRLPSASLTDTLLSSLPSQCPQLTHCHIAIIDNHNTHAGQRLRDEWQKRLSVLRSGLGAAVWSDSITAVVQQRLDKRWQREMGLGTA